VAVQLERASSLFMQSRRRRRRRIQILKTATWSFVPCTPLALLYLWPIPKARRVILSRLAKSLS